VVEVDVGPQGAQQAGTDLREFDGGPLDLADLAAGLEREAATGAESADEPADAGAGLERPDDAVVAGELGEQRAQRLGERVGDDRRV
jgi:hypothetical protein